MNNQQYKTPNSSVDLPVQGSSVKAVLYGLAVDIGGSILSGIVYAAIYGFYLASTGMPLEKIEKVITQTDYTTVYGIIGAVIGCFFTFLGGYVCANKSIVHVYRDVSIFCLLTTLFGWVVGKDVEFMRHIILSAFTIASAFLGGYVAKPKSV